MKDCKYLNECTYYKQWKDNLKDKGKSCENNEVNVNCPWFDKYEHPRNTMGESLVNKLMEKYVK